MRALIIDDSRAMRTIIRGIVKKFGFETVEAGNGREALERLADTDDITVAMVDWNMPEMNGYDFVCEARSNSAYDDIQLVMVTTETEMDQVTKAIEAGANEYVMKPFTEDILLEKLEMLGIGNS